MKVKINCNFFIIVLTTIYLVWALTPTLKETLNGTYFGVLALFVLFLTFFTDFWDTLEKPEASLVIIILAYLILQVFYILINYSTSPLDSLQNYGLFSFSFIIGLFIKKKCTEKEKKFIILAIVGIILVNAIIRLLPEIFGVTVVSNLDSEIDDSTTYGHAVFIFGMLSFIMFLTKKGIKSIAWLACSVISIAYNIYIVTRGTTFILGVVSFVLFIVFYKNPEFKKKKYIFIFFLIVFLLLFGKTIYNEILTIKDGKLSGKLDSVESVINGTATYGDKTTSLTERIFLIGVDFKTWFSSFTNFIIGKGDDVGFWQISGIGKHSDLFDVLPEFGIIGFSMFFSIYFGYFKYLVRESKEKSLVIIFEIILAVLFIINRITGVQVGPTFYLLPVILLDKHFNLSDKGDSPVLINNTAEETQ